MDGDKEEARFGASGLRGLVVEAWRSRYQNYFKPNNWFKEQKKVLGEPSVG